MRRASFAGAIGCILVLVSLCAMLEQAAAGQATTAAQIRKISGIDHGLCILIGSGAAANPALAADLAAPGKMLVHGVALDEPSCLRARQAVAAARVEGLATIEIVPFDPLPHRGNMANLIVVDENASSFYSRQEAMRVLAPLGKLCVNTKGKWDVAVKPMPKEMDEWTHSTSHGPDGSFVSRDTLVKFPIGYQWNADLPMNDCDPKRAANAWSSTRGMALTGGRCFTISSSVLENLPQAYFLDHGTDQYVTARDAFNGLFLWRKSIGGTYYGGLYYLNYAPFIAAGERVYVASGDGKLLALDAATGKTEFTCATTYAPGRILLDAGVLVAATWKNGTSVGALNGVDRRRMDFSVDAGTVEGFDAATGKRLWIIEKLAISIRSADGLLYMVQREGPDPLEESGHGPRENREGKTPLPARPGQNVVAVGLHDGTARWTVSSRELGSEDYLRVDSAGLAVVAVLQDTGEKSFLLSAADGKPLMQAPGAHAEFYEGAINVAGKKYDPQTVKELGAAAIDLKRPFCTPSYFVNGIVVGNRGGDFYVAGKQIGFPGARGGCLVGTIPAYGALYTPQNWCCCVSGQIQGIICMSPIASAPTPDEMEQAAPVEKGPEYQSPPADDSTEQADQWPMLRNDGTRSNASSSPAPFSLKATWAQSVAAPADGQIAFNWRESLNGPLTAPVVSGGLVAVAAMDRHQVVALNASTGKEKWRAVVGGRIDTPPTLYRGLCLVGAHDGYLYAFNANSGNLAWRMRMAPRQERMVSYGMVESPWPVIGSVLISDGVAYASVGKSQGSDGGLLVRAFDPLTGAVRWSKALARPNSGHCRPNDILVKVAGSVQLGDVRMNLSTGEFVPNPTLDYLRYVNKLNSLKAQKKDTSELKELETKEVAPSAGNEGFICWNWTRLGTRKFQAMTLGAFHPSGVQISWNGAGACALQNLGRGVTLFPMDKIKPAGDPQDLKDAKWNVELPKGYQASAVILCPNAVVIGGAVYSQNPQTSKGFVRVLSLEKGETAAETVFDSPLAYSALAVASEGIFASFDDGTVACLGAAK